MVSSRPSCIVRASMISGWPPSWAMPISKDSRVRVELFSKITATDRGPASGLRPNGSALNSAARSSTSRCSSGVRSSSRKKCLREFLGIVTSPHPGWLAAR
jgi:hypothetical protein